MLPPNTGAMRPMAHVQRHVGAGTDQYLVNTHHANAVLKCLVEFTPLDLHTHATYSRRSSI